MPVIASTDDYPNLGHNESFSKFNFQLNGNLKPANPRKSEPFLQKGALPLPFAKNEL